MEKIKALREQLKEKKVFAGFDGYTDMLYSIVKRDDGGQKEIYRQSGEFVENLRSTSGMSSEYQIMLKEERIGGNAPIMSIGMAAMGANVCCAGLFNKQIERLRKGTQGRLKIYSLGEPAVTIALEFQDCKYMLADCSKLESVTYSNLVRIMGENAVREDILMADLIAAVNWSAVPALTEMLEYIFQLETCHHKKKCRWLYLDLSDVRARETKELKKYFATVKQIKKYTGCQTCLSVNQNELNILIERYRVEGRQKIKMLRRLLEVDEIIYHGLKDAVFCSEDIYLKTEKNICEKPKITTGAGDNFNAGICVGKLLELSPEKQLKMGNKAAEFYVFHGYSAKLEDLIY